MIPTFKNTILLSDALELASNDLAWGRGGALAEEAGPETRADPIVGTLLHAVTHVLPQQTQQFHLLGRQHRAQSV